jgi:hypothetical protein
MNSCSARAILAVSAHGGRLSMRPDSRQAAGQFRRDAAGGAVQFLTALLSVHCANTAFISAIDSRRGCIG